MVLRCAGVVYGHPRTVFPAQSLLRLSGDVFAPFPARSLLLVLLWLLHEVLVSLGCLCRFGVWSAAALANGAPLCP